MSGRNIMIHEIKLLPYVEVYFPKLDEVLASDRVVKRDVGELVLNGKCLGGRVNDGSMAPSATSLRCSSGRGLSS